MIDFDKIINRKNTNSIKFEVFSSVNNGDVIPLWIADMDFACPECVLDEIKKRLDDKILGYTGIFDDEYYQIVCDWMKEKHDIVCDKDNIVFSNGVVSAMKQTVNRLTQKGDKVLILTPSYTPFFTSTVLFEREPLLCPLKNTGDNWEIDFEDFEKKASQSKLFFFCSPHNPIGKVWSKEEIEKIVEICKKYDLFIFSDEIHHDILRTGVEHVATQSLCRDYPKLITATSVSKTFNLAGMSISNIIFNDKEIASQWRAVHACGSPNPLSLAACKAAYSKCHNWLRELKLYLDKNFVFTKEFLAEHLPKAKFNVPQGTYLAWIDLSGYGLCESELKSKLESVGVIVEYASDFVANGDGFIRANVALPKSILHDALQRIKIALN